MHLSVDRFFDSALAVFVHVLHEDEPVEGALVALEEREDLAIALALEHHLGEYVRVSRDAGASGEVAHDDLGGDPKDDADHQLFDDELVAYGAEVIFETGPERFGLFLRRVGELAVERVHEVCLL